MHIWTLFPLQLTTYQGVRCSVFFFSFILLFVFLRNYFICFLFFVFSPSLMLHLTHSSNVIASVSLSLIDFQLLFHSYYSPISFYAHLGNCGKKNTRRASQVNFQTYHLEMISSNMTKKYFAWDLPVICPFVWYFRKCTFQLVQICNFNLLCDIIT